MPPSIHQLQRHIRTSALDTACIFLTRHAQERMHQRFATPAIVYEVLQSGVLAGIPEPSNAHADEVICKMQRRVCGENWIVCVAVQYPAPDLVVITVYELEGT